MSEQEQEQTPTPPEGDEAPPQVEPLTPPEPTTEPEPVGRTPEQESGEPPSDQEQGVGVAPTEPGDAGEGNPGTHFQTTEEIENPSGSGEGDETAEAI
jgi:hypothetical protein